MPAILMCPPKFFEVCYVINPWMGDNQGKVNHTLASEQWQNLYHTISKLTKVVLIDPVAGLPDMVFTANAGLARNKSCVVSSFRHAQRQPEAAYFAQFFQQQGYLTQQLSTVFEGAGDALFDSLGRLWMGTGFRSEPHALTEIADFFHVPTLGLELIDPRWYHLDTAFCPLKNGQAMAYAGAFSKDSCQLLQTTFADKILWVSETDALNFACNAVNIGNKVILHQATLALEQALAQRGFKVIENNVSEFLKAGGACKCLTLELHHVGRGAE